MSKKKTEEVVEEVKKPAKKKTSSGKVSEKVIEKPEQVYIYHTGDDLEKISEILTGRKYMEYAVLNASGLNMNTLKDGDILKWGI